MARQARAIDASSMPDVARPVHDVNQTGRPRLIQAGGDTARLSPARRRRAASLTPAQREEILRATFGGWKGLVDPNQLKQELNDLQRDESTPRRL